jgi:hypothetical protein
MAAKSAGAAGLVTRLPVYPTTSGGEKKATGTTATGEAAPSVTQLPVRPNAAGLGKKGDIISPATPSVPAHTLSHAERAAAGKALRDNVPRIQHSAWKKSETRADPIDLLQAADKDRLPDLVPIRYGRMLQSPFAFYRGAAVLMAADLATTPVTGIGVQACGDCHLMNFGGFATPERNVIFDINDFDETLPAPWEWDIKRLVASFALAARSLSMSDAKAREAAVTCASSYREHLRKYTEMHPLQTWYTQVTSDDIVALMPKAKQSSLKDRIAKATAQSGSEVDFPKLAGMVGGQLSIRDTPPLIFHPDEERSPEFKTILDQVFTAYRET